MTAQACGPVAEPQLKRLTPTDDERAIKVGIPSNYDDTDETRLLLTPEACGLLVARGYRVMLQAGAGIDISYSDDEYANNGVVIADRDTVLDADVVIATVPLRTRDIKKMHSGAAMMCFMDAPLFEKTRIKALLDGKITCICLDNLTSSNGDLIFANILDEIDGRAAIMYAQEGLSYLGEGKGVLLAGVAGVNPCEVLIIGQGWKVICAAKAAIYAGAKVTLMDNDVSALQDAKEVCGDQLGTASLHPRVVFNAVRTADVIITDRCSRDYTLSEELSTVMKESVYFLDLATTSPSLSVPRTVAMAFSNLLANFFHDLMLCGGMDNMIASTAGLQSGVVTYHGSLTDKLISINTGLPCVDIAMLLGPIN